MSLLPQRKKSAEEIAQLRESLGVPPLSEGSQETPAADTGFETIVPTHHEATVVHHPAEPAPIPKQKPEPLPAHHGPRQVRSLRKSEQIPALPVEASTPDPEPVPHLPKPVRSLRKSEQVPVLVPAPAKPGPDAKIPFHRHSDEEIAEIRRRDALALLNPPPPNPKLAAAHPGILIPGYLCAIAGASCFIFYQFTLAATAACATAALMIAAFVFVRRPLSRHHAGFIAMIALFVIVFGTLHFFPHLRHAT